MIGLKKSESRSSTNRQALIVILRIRQNIREGHPDFIISEDLWPAFLYPHGKYDPNNIEVGLFKSALMVKV